METTKLEAAIEKAAGELPGGWVINICVERSRTCITPGLI